LEVEAARKRIALTLRLDDQLAAKGEGPAQGKPRDIARASMTSAAPRKKDEPGGGAFAEAFRLARDKQGKAGT
ncbi:MAG: hypothetical protein KGK16_05375, partial [Bradyrhizobium sp.]|nr:hypothetical protein [Bradyrhizobium sp.]